VSRPAVQMQIDLGAADHVGLLHHAHNSDISIATNSGKWREKVFTKQAAIDQAVILSNGGAVDCYVSQNPTQDGQRRAVSNLSCLQNLYVDLDTYNVPALAGLDYMRVYDLIRDAHPDLPKPTMVASSGRGLYLVWTLRTTKPVSSLPAWQAIENNLIDQLLPFGADPKAKDAARVLRISCTENSKSGTNAAYHHIAPPVTFEAMQRYSNKLTKQAAADRQAAAPERRQAAEQRLDKSQQVQQPRLYNVRLAGGHTAKNAYTLAYARMNDLKTLAQIRGGRLTDLRKTAIYAYSLAASWYSYSVQQLRREVECFIDQCVDQPEAYKMHHMPGTVFDRKEQSLDGVKIEWQGKQWDARYRIKNTTLIKLLEITPAEQLHMTAIIGKAEKYARKNQKRNERRWKEGKATRQAYEATTADRRQLALQLAAAGSKQAEIAQAWNVSIRSVKRYVNG
jgi:hypothetical protein